MSKIVAVAMSGGIDSSFALLKLKEEGYKVFGVTLKLFSNEDCPGNYGDSPFFDSIEEAKNICSSIGVDHFIVDVRKAFRSEVIDYFIKSYREGLTPNPCVLCNRIIKWKYLLDSVLSRGADFLATGHYVRVDYCNERKRFLLKCGIDYGKDQSYYLWRLSQEHLSLTLFPLGYMKKGNVKEEIKKYNLSLAEKPESQEVCFITDNDYRNFLKKAGDVTEQPGNILDTSGKILGVHRGYPFYTIGQRRGLGISSGERLYVKSIDVVKNEIVLGAFEELYEKEVLFSQANFIAYEIPPEDVTLKARIRYRGKPEECRIKCLDEGKFLLTFLKPVWGVCPGQSVVIYEEDIVVGGGIIED